MRESLHAVDFLRSNEAKKKNQSNHLDIVVISSIF